MSPRGVALPGDSQFWEAVEATQFGTPAHDMMGSKKATTLLHIVETAKLLDIEKTTANEARGVHGVE